MRVPEPLLRRARSLAGNDDRVLLGIAGAPGSGKTSFAVSLVAALRAGPPSGLGAEAVAYLPMDGFHLSDGALDRLGHRDRKGAPETFDVAGYANLLRRLRSGERDVIYAPAFERDLEQPIAGSIAIVPSARLVVTEGNYLLLDDGSWPAVRAQLDEVWFVEVDQAVRRARLMRRHEQFGKTHDEAVAWVDRVDEPNAALIAASRVRADLVVAADLTGSSST